MSSEGAGASTAQRELACARRPRKASAETTVPNARVRFCPQETHGRARIIHLYSGETRPGDVQSHADRAGLEYVGFDKRQGHDVRDPAVRDLVIHTCREGGHLAAGPNCRSFSSLRDITCEPTRSRLEPWGLEPMPARWKAYIDGENFHITLTAEAAAIVFEGGETSSLSNRRIMAIQTTRSTNQAGRTKHTCS